MLDQVKTVQDLINLNNTTEEPVSVKDKILSEIMDQEPKMGLALTMDILEALKDFHMNAIEVLKKEGD